MTNNDLKKFFADRPALSRKGIAEESGITRRMLFNYLEGENELTARSEKKLKPILEKYGY